MENIFDGIQRPLESIFEEAGKTPFVPLGVDVPALNRTKQWNFKPLNFSEGQTIVGGSIFGEVRLACCPWSLPPCVPLP